MRYIALLRGINVGGHQVKMDRLRELFGEVGLAGVRTYIQTGNVFFESAEADRAGLTRRIEAHLREALGYEVPTFLRSVSELERTLALDPFKGMDVTDDMRLSIVFAAGLIPGGLELPAWSVKRDMEIRRTTEREAFVVWYLKDGRPPVSQDFLEKTLGGKVTSRFLHTTAKILEAAKAGQ
jgi:uncharacterized protein (DUF1697 family)